MQSAMASPLHSSISNKILVFSSYAGYFLILLVFNWIELNPNIRNDRLLAKIIEVTIQSNLFQLIKNTRRWCVKRFKDKNRWSQNVEFREKRRSLSVKMAPKSFSLNENETKKSLVRKWIRFNIYKLKFALH